MSETYQSRIFTFLSNRTNQLKNNCAKSLRHLKVAVVWSSQILLYPLQLLTQTKIFQPQISTPPPQLALPQPVPDINIEQALDLVEVAGYPMQIAERVPLAVDDWSFIDEDLWNTAYGNHSIKSQEIAYSPHTSSQVTPPKPMIRGLSSLLLDRQLVLVTVENELLNILTISQQQEIRRRIGMDLATTWDRWYPHHLAGNHAQQELSTNQKLCLTNGNIADPDRDLHSRSLTSGKSPNLFDRLRNWFQNSMGETSQPDAQLQSAFIPSAVTKFQQQLAPSTDNFTPQPPRFDRYLELPQLPPFIENDLPPEPASSINIAITNIATKIQPDWLKNWWNYYREYVYIPSVDITSLLEQDDLVDIPLNQGEILHSPAEFKLIPIEPTPSKIKVKQQDRINQIRSKKNPKQPQIQQTSSINLTAEFDRHLEYHQDWIEAETETIGYSQSPLAKLLAWLDRLMFRLENWLLAAIRYPGSILRQWF